MRKNLNLNKLVVIIPAYNPDEKLLHTLKSLKETGFSNIIIVNDGSKDSCKNIFEQAEEIIADNGVILKHSVNLGQGRAYKTAFNYYLEYYKDSIGVIQCDADGQHHIEDVYRCAELLLDNPNCFVLGERNFDAAGIPFRSRFGNKCTSFVFKVFCGLNINDTQTGLKGIPRSAIRFLIETTGERFEYATSVLLEIKKRGIQIIRFDIKTIYINENESSHFNPILDSIRIYSVLLKYIMASLSAFVIDIVVFSVFINLYKNIFAGGYIVAANYTAKLISCTYSFFINKNLVFANKGKATRPMLKFVLLCIIQATLSSVFVNGIYSTLHWNETLIKIIVDTLLFFVSFEVQQHWVFKQKEIDHAN